MKLKFRKKLNKNIRRIVVKVGSLGVTHPDGGIDLKKINRLTSDIARLKKQGLQVILVSSGAINAGVKHVAKKEENSLSFAQACSAVGQPLLIHAYQEAFSKEELVCAQVLMTHDDLKNKTRYLNIRNTLLKLLESDIVPILNENDSVSFEEITVGDNDQLAAVIAKSIFADLLVLLSSTDGLYNKDPLEEGSKKFESVSLETDLAQIKTFTKTNAGRGGMKSKLYAVLKVADLGTDVVISSFQDEQPITRSITEENAGTVFISRKNSKDTNKKVWITTTVKPGAVIKVDEGAYKALIENASLLPIGIKEVIGLFKRGDSVALQFRRKVFAYGISEYSAKEVAMIAGKKSSEIQSILSKVHSKTVIHRNNLHLK